MEKKHIELLKLLNLENDDIDYSIVFSYYEKKKNEYQNLLEKTQNMKGRIQLQNLMIELDDCFLEYQSAMLGEDFKKPDT